jgi:hypothetical protein
MQLDLTCRRHPKEPEKAKKRMTTDGSGQIENVPDGNGAD